MSAEVPCWYLDDAPEGAFWAWSEELCQNAADQRDMAEAAMTVYLGRDFSFTGKRYSVAGLLGALLGDADINDGLEPIGYNVVASVTDTMAGHILRNKVRPQFVTEKANVQEQQQAIGMQRAVEGEFHNARMYGFRAVDSVYRGLIMRGGGVKVVPDPVNKRLDWSFVWDHEFFVPQVEAYRGRPMSMVHQYDVDRSVLLRAYGDDPKIAEAIRKAPTFNPDAYETTVSDRVRVREAWHLPTLDPDIHEDHDGVRIIAIEGATLLREPWRYNHFPVAWFKPMVTQGTYWSRGYPERLAGAQQKLNEYQDRIDSILNLHARPLLIAWARAGLNRSKITNSIANILLSKVPPQQALWQMTPQAVPRELVERVQAIIAWAEKQAGVSELSISAQKPQGIEHAPALRYLADFEAVRHTMVFSAWEQFYLDLAEIVVDSLRELCEQVEDYETIFANNEELVRVPWRKMDLGKNRYILTCWPTNLLPSTPSAKIATLIEMTQNQLISPKEAMTRFENPDVKDLLGDQSAASENIERLIRRAVEGKPNAVPHPYMDLALLQVKLKERINRLQANGEDSETVGRLIDLFTSARQLELKMAAETNLASGKGGVAGIQAAAGMPGAGAPPPPAPPAPAPGAAPPAPPPA